MKSQWDCLAHLSIVMFVQYPNNFIIFLEFLDQVNNYCSRKIL
jgi:hypothetical protein